MNSIESIMNLMKHDLTAVQLEKLQSVLEAVLAVQKDLPPIDDLIRRFETSKRLMGIKDTSLCQYTLEVRMLSKNMSKPLNQLTTTDIKDYLSRYRSEHSISMVTIQNKLRFLSSFFEFMLDDGYITKNPIKGIGRILVEKRIKKAFTAEDLARIRDSCRTLRDRALVEFLYSTGCRVSECTALQVKDIDFRADELIVFGKGHKERVCYLNKTAKSYLREYLRSRNAAQDAPLFCHTRVDARLTPRSVELILKDIGQRAIVENVHPHRFRRTFATDLWKAGVPVETIRILMGHTNIATTLRYIDIDPCGVKQAFTRAQKVMAGKK